MSRRQTTHAPKPPGLGPDSPRLSEILHGFKSRKKCQHCGTTKGPVYGWIEHDHNDRPEPNYIFLCEPCAGKLIEPHPRLYRQFNQFEPLPGVMDICGPCGWRINSRCTCPRAVFNGGAEPGLKIDIPAPASAFVDGPKFRGRMAIWHSPATACDGFKPK